jgi:hypothetical protein
MALNPKMGPNPPNPPESPPPGGPDAGAEELVRASFEEENGGSRNLPLYHKRKTTLTILTRSVLGAMGRDWEAMSPDDLEAWRRVVERVAEERRPDPEAAWTSGTPACRERREPLPDGNPGRAENRVDEELGLLIQRRHEEREENGEPDAANAAEQWRGGMTPDEEEERRRAWLDWHTRRAETLEALASEHRAERRKLLAAGEAERSGTWATTNT